MKTLGLNRLNNIIDKIPENTQNQEFAAKLLQKLNITVSVLEKSLQNIPQKGGALITCNCPHGLLDILIITSVIFARRPDAKFLIASRLANIKPFKECALATEQLTHTTTTRKAEKFLANGGLLITFPAEEASTYSRFFRNITDTEWHHKSLRLAKLANTPIIPIYIEGRNSLKFLITSKLSPTLSILRHPLELLNKSQTHVEMAIGEAITYDNAGRTPVEVSHFVRTCCYLLGERMKAHRENITKDTKSCVYQPLEITKQQTAFIQNYEKNILRLIQIKGKKILENNLFITYTLDSNTVEQEKLYTDEQLSKYTGKQRNEIIITSKETNQIVLVATAITARQEVSELAHKRFASHSYFEFSTRKIAKLMQNCVEISCTTSTTQIDEKLETFLYESLIAFAEKNNLKYIITNLTAQAAEGSVGFAILARYLRARKWSDPLAQLIVPRSGRVKIRSSAAIDAVRGVKKTDLIFSILHNIEGTSPLKNPTAHTLLKHSAKVAALATEQKEQIAKLNALIILEIQNPKNVSRGTTKNGKL